MASAIPLPLRAVGCLTTREIAAAFLVPEATMAQRSRAKAKAKVKASDKPFVLPSTEQQAGRPDRRLMARWSCSQLLGYAEPPCGFPAASNFRAKAVGSAISVDFFSQTTRKSPAGPRASAGRNW